MEKKHSISKFTGGLGFVLAASGSAVGLGNIWRFPYLAAKYGGGIFLLTYLILVFTFGFTLMTLEIALGRKHNASPLTAFAAFGKKYAFIGWIPFIVPVVILPYYCVIGGWVTRYLVEYIMQNGAELASDGFFGGMVSAPVSPLVYTAVFLGLTGAVLFQGVQKGIERFSKVLMPLLILLSIIITVYSVTLPGAMEGVKYFFIPHFDQFSPTTVLAALGQMFFSLSIAMGIMITYGSYLPKGENIEKCVGTIEIFDTVVAVLAGLMTIPAVFAFSGGDPNALQTGPSMLFRTLPKVFGSMTGGGVFGIIFFVLVFVAVLTSSISVMETIVSNLVDKFKMGRRKAIVLVFTVSMLMAFPASLGYGLWDGVTIFGMAILDFMDFLTNSVLMPVGALLTCVFIGWVVGTKTITDEVKLSSDFKREKLFNVMVKYIAPILVAAVLITSTLQSMGVLTI